MAKSKIIMKECIMSLLNKVWEGLRHFNDKLGYCFALGLMKAIKNYQTDCTLGWVLPCEINFKAML